jgi:hypothetical protein
MPDIPIQNETEYTLTASILEQIRRDALEYFGDSVRAIRVQYGIDRHAFNARTGEMRYAFSPGDFGLVDMKVALPELQPGRHDIPSIDDEEEEVDEVAFEEVDVGGADEAEPAFESLEEEELDDVEDEEEASFQDLEDEYEEMDDEDKDYLYDEDEYE